MTSKSSAAQAIIVFLAAFFLLWGLDRPYLWQDEAATAVLAERMLQFGRPLAYDGKNLITIDYFPAEDADSVNQRTRSAQAAVSFYAHRGDFKPDTTWKWQPWGQFVVAAISLKLLGAGTGAARLPFALAGVLTVWVTYWLVRRCFLDWQLAAIVSGSLALNPYWLLHGRQCRYYALSSLCLVLTLASYASWQWGPSNRRWLGAGFFVVLAWLWFQVDYGTIWPALGLLFLDALVAERRTWWRPVLVGMVLATAIAPFAYYYEIWGRWSIPASSWFRRFAVNFFNVNEYVAPGLVVATALGLMILRWNKLREVERRLMLIACAIVLALLIWVPAIAPAAFLRYVILAAPLGCLLAAWVLFQLAGRQHRVLAWAGAVVFVLTPALSLPISYPLHLLHGGHYRAALFRPGFRVLWRNITGKQPDPNGGVVECLRQNSNPDDEILINYEDIPLMFYLPNPIRGGVGSFRAEDDGKRPPDVIVLSPSANCVHWPVYLREQQRYQWRTIPVKIPDVSCGNCPEPHVQESMIGASVPDIFVAKRVSTGVSGSTLAK
jgi:hypothetical protein